MVCMHEKCRTDKVGGGLFIGSILANWQRRSQMTFDLSPSFLLRNKLPVGCAPLLRPLTAPKPPPRRPRGPEPAAPLPTTLSPLTFFWPTPLEESESTNEASVVETKYEKAAAHRVVLCGVCLSRDRITMTPNTTKMEKRRETE